MVNYYLLMKPGIILGNLFTFAAGFLLASKGEINPLLFIESLLGLSLIIASACVFNNYIDHTLDKKMERTKNRALATGKIKGSNAILFATILGLTGNLILFYFTNNLTVAVANVGFIVYVFFYSFLKLLTTYSTLIGSISGAIPPLVGYCAVSNQLDLAAGILFFILIFWQMPHFFSIALWHRNDYIKAGIPLLPIEKTKAQIILYILVFIPTTSLLTYYGYTGPIFLAVTLTIGLAWLYYSFKGFKTDNNSLWGRQMFRLSLLMINAICLTLPFDLNSAT